MMVSRGVPDRCPQLDPIDAAHKPDDRPNVNAGQLRLDDELGDERPVERHARSRRLRRAGR